MANINQICEHLLFWLGLHLTLTVVSPLEYADPLISFHPPHFSPLSVPTVAYSLLLSFAHLYPYLN